MGNDFFLLLQLSPPAPNHLILPLIPPWLCIVNHPLTRWSLWTSNGGLGADIPDYDDGDHISESGSTRLRYVPANGLKCLKRQIEMFGISDSIPAFWIEMVRWNVGHELPAHRHFGPLPSVLPMYLEYNFISMHGRITIVADRVKSGDWPEHACHYQYWWIVMAVCGSLQKLLKSCGRTFQTCRYKIHLHLS